MFVGLYGCGICGVCMVVSVVCGLCRWWIGLWWLDWRGDVCKPVAGLVEIKVKHGWCVYVVGT